MQSCQNRTKRNKLSEKTIFFESLTIETSVNTESISYTLMKQTKQTYCFAGFVKKRKRTIFGIGRFSKTKNEISFFIENSS
jgi:hypothetical protein